MCLFTKDIAPTVVEFSTRTEYDHRTGTYNAFLLRGFIELKTAFASQCLQAIEQTKEIEMRCSQIESELAASTKLFPNAFFVVSSSPQQSDTSGLFEF